jgi:hypothetical protein
MTRFAVAFPAAARPYPGEVPVPVHEHGVAVAQPGYRPEPADDVYAHNAAAELTRLTEDPDFDEPGTGQNGCTGVRADGQPCNGRAGDDGRCARHKEP